MSALRAPRFDPSEREFQSLVCEAAEMLGWEWSAFGAGQTSKGWRTPARGPLGPGWPDLFMGRERDGRLLWAELKTNYGRLSPDQEHVLSRLRPYARLHGFITVAVWRPRDWDVIVEILT